MVKQAIKIVEVVGIKVPNKVQQQIWSQYANDIKFTIIILSIKVLSIIDFLKVFSIWKSQGLHTIWLYNVEGWFLSWQIVQNKFRFEDDEKCL
jgi:hypothetical protein